MLEVCVILLFPTITALMAIAVVLTMWAVGGAPPVPDAGATLSSRYADPNQGSGQ